MSTILGERINTDAKLLAFLWQSQEMGITYTFTLLQRTLGTVNGVEPDPDWLAHKLLQLEGAQAIRIDDRDGLRTIEALCTVS